MNNPYNKQVPVAGIGFGQAGYWGNDHFSSFESAKAAFDKYVAELIASYTKQFPAGPIVEDGGFNDRPASLADGNVVVHCVRVVNRLKSGKRGKMVHTVHLYRIYPECAERFIADPFYSCKS